METSSIGRLPILRVTPDLGVPELSPKAYVGEVVPFGATSFREGHDVIGVALHLRAPDGQSTRLEMHPTAPGTDRWEVQAQPDKPGLWTFTVEAYSDDYATWHHNAEVKIPLGIDVELMLTLGSQLFTRASTEASRTAAHRKKLAALAKSLVDTKVDPLVRFSLAEGEEVQSLLAHAPIASLETFSEEYTLRVERALAGSASWYEFFPRSEGATQDAEGVWTSGTFRTAAKRLPAVAKMGFDVVYLPPIHPIGTLNRKGPNNSLVTEPGDPGSPWAIGSAAGGHDAIHPDLGNFKDFAFFLTEAKKHNIEIALDLALQAAPDHPWVTTNPEWFTTLPDGTIAYAENPPKKYQDIYPINFDNDPEGIRAEVLRVVEFWISKGISIFRVDNPHTKPVDFWEWLIKTVNEKHPDVIFLAEAFTRPAMMHTLGKIGFQQSYSYFTWRNTKWELEEFFRSISTESADFMRPNLFVNTPDILTEYLQFGGPAAFTIRATLAATAAPLWGVYAGFELFESVARPGAEEYIDNEKYEYKNRDWAALDKAGTSLAPFFEILNSIRAEHPALRQLRNITIQRTDDDAILAYSKHLDKAFTGTGADDTLIMVVNTDPHSVRETVVHLDLTTLGAQHGDSLTVTNLVTGVEWTWGADNYVRLDPFTEPVHILHVTKIHT
ncbi:starch synthase (maltosyl-transferring) [Aurantimicrobium minutum]|uniref:alpha-1,4-glucan--maltose-1-phosphate maltosyltransferase n=1 Tax=Aurantimicrobium minutum TaxID=708131 RepID=UPI00247481ED|nr:alpha-1,4-glucan--maltose-1-phosphate maltosyltransferase [Aurantimicrobium minutum]MDH6532717.1 starch synthase (maltosyl-transferring) [Aurantimicrobium minutum]